MENNLKELLANHSLDELEALFSAQMSKLNEERYEAKKSMMLAMLAKACMDTLLKIDIESFPKKLAEELAAIETTYRSRLEAFTEQQQENRRIMQLIARANTELPEIDRRTADLLRSYDEILRAVMADRDKLPVGQLL